jgi:alkylation response protein AidB-like acyl-CoA dehydrogenase
VKRTVFEPEHEEFRAAVRAWIARDLVPNREKWDAAGIVDREVFRAAAQHGFTGSAIPAEYGGAGVDDFRFNAVLSEEAQRAGLTAATLGLSVHNDVVLPYLLSYATAEQKARWLPGIASGEIITAIAMTEPGTGSDLAGIRTSAVRHGEHYLVDGAKTFISNGINADLVVVAVRTDPAQPHRGLTLLVVERDQPGFTRGRNLDKIGLHAQDTAELSFADAAVPVANRLGAEGAGFGHLVANLAQERLGIAVMAVAAARATFDATVEYVRDRKVFGAPVADLQHTRMRLAELSTDIEIGRTWVDRCLEAHVHGELDPADAARAKFWSTEMQGRVSDGCLQLFGGYGYMSEYPVARAFVDGRVSRIYGGTTEVMKEIVARSLGLTRTA